jgi:hypothetical protein
VDLTPWIAAGSTVSLLALAFTTIFRVMRTVPRVYREQINSLAVAVADHAEEIERLKEANRRCERRLTLVIWAHQSGTPIPDEVWS